MSNQCHCWLLTDINDARFWYFLDKVPYSQIFCLLNYAHLLVLLSPLWVTVCWINQAVCRRQFQLVFLYVLTFCTPEGSLVNLENNHSLTTVALVEFSVAFQFFVFSSEPEHERTTWPAGPRVATRTRQPVALFFELHRRQSQFNNYEFFSCIDRLTGKNKNMCSVSCHVGE